MHVGERQITLGMQATENASSIINLLKNIVKPRKKITFLYLDLKRFVSASGLA